MRWEAAVRCAKRGWAYRNDEAGKTYLCSWPYKLNTMEQIAGWARRVKHMDVVAIDPTGDEHDDWVPLNPRPNVIDMLGAIGMGED